MNDFRFSLFLKSRCVIHKSKLFISQIEAEDPINLFDFVNERIRGPYAICGRNLRIKKTQIIIQNEGFGLLITKKLVIGVTRGHLSSNRGHLSSNSTNFSDPTGYEVSYLLPGMSENSRPLWFGGSHSYYVIDVSEHALNAKKRYKNHN